MNTIEKVRESNRIEGIRREPTREEIVEHDRFVAQEVITVGDLRRFISVYQPNAELRDVVGLNVIVGDHRPPVGGPHIRTALSHLLDDINDGGISAWTAHVRYETLHPFTDGNGRSGRAIWYWMMRDSPMANLGFLHAFYYQALQNTRIGERPSTDNATHEDKP